MRFAGSLVRSPVLSATIPGLVSVIARVTTSVILGAEQRSIHPYTICRAFSCPWALSGVRLPAVCRAEGRLDARGVSGHLLSVLSETHPRVGPLGPVAVLCSPLGHLRTVWCPGWTIGVLLPAPPHQHVLLPGFLVAAIRVGAGWLSNGALGWRFCND